MVRSVRSLIVLILFVSFANVFILSLWLYTIASKPRTEKLYNEINDGAKERPWYKAGGERQPGFDRNLKLFPEELPGSDRIIEQLMYALPKAEEHRPIKTILLANGFSEWKNVASGQTEFTEAHCPVDRCNLTDFQGASSTADAVIFVLHPAAFKPTQYQFYVTRPPKQVWIFYSLENPYISGLTNRNIKVNLFNWTATYRRDSDIVTPYQRWLYHDPPTRSIDKNYAATKTKKVAALISNCRTFNTRLKFAFKLGFYIKVDIFGLCGPYKCNNWEDCFEQIRKYKFFLSFENANCRDYITEKFFVNGLQQDVLPIVMGARPNDYAAVAPHKSYLHVDQFMSVEELAAQLHVLDEDDHLYNSYFKWKGTGEFINTFFFCRLCAMLHASDLRNRTAHYVDVEFWWKHKTCMGTREHNNKMIQSHVQHISEFSNANY